MVGTRRRSDRCACYYVPTASFGKYPLYFGLLCLSNHTMQSRKEPDSKQIRAQLESSDSDENAMALTTEDREMLHTISTQLKKLDILKELKADVLDLKHSVEYNNGLIEELKKENKALQKEVAHLQSVTTSLTNDNTKLKVTLLDLQCRGTRDNLLLMGIEEKETETYETLEVIMRKFAGASQNSRGGCYENPIGVCS